MYNCVIEVVLLNMFVGMLINVLSTIRADELKKFRREERKEMAFVEEMQRRMNTALAPSNKPWSTIWEIYEAADLSGDEMKLDAELVLAANAHMFTLEQILTDVNIPIFGRTKEGYICYANAAFEQWTGTDDLLQTPTCAYFPHQMDLLMSTRQNMAIAAEIEATEAEIAAEHAGNEDTAHSIAVELALTASQLAEGTHIFHDIEVASKRRHPTGLWFKMHYRQLDFCIASVNSGSGTSDQHGRGMLFWMVPAWSRNVVLTPEDSKCCT